MSHKQAPKTVIVDFGMGNLHSVQQACQIVGLPALITPKPEEIRFADAVILPGVGAFGDAMNVLRNEKLIEPLQRFSESEKPFFGVCLGMQLLMSESFEFGNHSGLGIVSGSVVRIEPSKTDKFLKVPHVGWNQLRKPNETAWEETCLQGLPDGEYMYFVHSYYPIPQDRSVLVSTTRYGNTEFCSTLQKGAVFATQFHPERSGPSGLRIFKNFAARALSL